MPCRVHVKILQIKTGTQKTFVTTTLKQSLNYDFCVNIQVELSCPKEMTWKVNMHRGYLAICHPEEQQLNFIERLVEMASSLAIREWRRLPHIVSHVHTPLLQVSNTKCIKRFFFFLFWYTSPFITNAAAEC